MKKILIITLLTVTVVTAKAQLNQVLQASLTTGSVPNSVRVKVKSKNDANSGIISTVNFCLQLSSSITPKPTLSVTEVLPSTAVGTYSISDVSAETPGFYTWNIDGTDGSTATTWTANEEKEFIQVTFTGGPAGTPSQVRLVHVPDGGSTGASTFYLSIGGNPIILESELMYGPGAVNNTLGLYPGGNASFSLNGVTLPISWLDINANRKNNDAVINWTVENEEDNDFYSLERSTNGAQFTSVATINKMMMGRQTNRYSYTDKDIDQLKSAAVFYRVKQVDKDGQFTYSGVRSIRLTADGKAITIYPNPVKDGFTINIPVLNPADKKIRMNLINQTGQVLHAREISATQAANYYYDIKTPGVIPGEYMLQIILEGELLDTKKILVQR